MLMENISEETGAFNAPGENASRLVQGLMSQRRHFDRLSGYHPSLVFETMRNSTFFRAWFNALPDDLTGLNLWPLYLLAETGDESAELRRRERAWQPDPANLADEYNGPISEDGKPMRANASKWEEAVKVSGMAHQTRFLADMKLMEAGDVPGRLNDAASALVDLALEHFEPGEISEWVDCSSAVDVLATAAAIRLCLAALSEISEAAKHIARQQAEEMQRDLARIEGGAL